MSSSDLHERIIVTEHEPVLIPRTVDPSRAAPHNFGPVSCREETLFTAERPGHYREDFKTEIVDDWVRFMKSKNISHVLIIMEHHEFSVYEMDLKEFYTDAGLQVHHIPFSSEDSYQKIMTLIQGIDEQGERCVTHCTGGKGRCGRVACAWLCKKWRLSPIEASQEFIDMALKNGNYRLADVEKLKKWIGYSSC
jgi:Cyclin-dependent kinase inhibitor 3 (CDKN3)